MKETIVNQAGNWDYWSDEKKSVLKATENNTDVGEKLAYENDEFRIWTIYLPAGEWFNFHRHSLGHPSRQ